MNGMMHGAAVKYTKKNERKACIRRRENGVKSNTQCRETEGRRKKFAQQ